MSDLERFKRLARSMACQLEAHGFNRIRAQRIEESFADGWWTRVAKWTNRPNICIWFDRTLGRRERVFWFGFDSPKRHLIRKLSKEARPMFAAEPVMITAKDWWGGESWPLPAKRIPG
jgi:hypothetical protein